MGPFVFHHRWKEIVLNGTDADAAFVSSSQENDATSFGERSHRAYRDNHIFFRLVSTYLCR
jgi:hypothetical protein